MTAIPTTVITPRFSISTILLFLMLCVARTASFRIAPALSSRNLFLLSRSVLMSSASSAIECPTIALRNGLQHPAICFGTYKVGIVPASASSAASGSAEQVERTAKECVADALAVGYRSLECAEFYGNEAQVGEAIVESKIPRSELFLCSKVWTTTIEKGPDAVRAQLEKTLKDLQTDYVDLYLM